MILKMEQSYSLGILALEYVKDGIDANYYVLCEAWNYSYYVGKVIVILDYNNVNVKFGLDHDENTLETSEKLIKKDSIFKLNAKDLR